jgi:DNA-binding transcriptional LysR family regulator
MTIAQLEYFISLAKTLSFTRTAEECHVSQPVVSQQIAALETDLGFRLFKRTTRGARLTEAGLVFYQNATEGIERLNLAKAHAAAAAHGQSSQLVIGIFGGIQYYGLREIAQFSRENPEVNLQFRIASPHQQYEQLKSGLFDTFFSSLSFLSRFEDVLLFNPLTNHVNAIVSNNHPLAYRRNITGHDVLQYKTIMSERAYYEMKEGLLDYPIAGKVKAENCLTCESFDIALLMVQLNLGIAFFPESTRDFLPKDVKMVKLKEDSWSIREVWCCLISNDNPALHQFIEFLNNQQEPISKHLIKP